MVLDSTHDPLQSWEKEAREGLTTIISSRGANNEKQQQHHSHQREREHKSNNTESNEWNKKKQHRHQQQPDYQRAKALLWQTTLDYIADTAFVATTSTAAEQNASFPIVSPLTTHENSFIIPSTARGYETVTQEGTIVLATPLSNAKQLWRTTTTPPTAWPSSCSSIKSKNELDILSEGMFGKKSSSPPLSPRQASIVSPPASLVGSPVSHRSNKSIGRLSFKKPNENDDVNDFEEEKKDDLTRQQIRSPLAREPSVQVPSLTRSNSGLGHRRSGSFCSSTTGSTGSGDETASTSPSSRVKMAVAELGFEKVERCSRRAGGPGEEDSSLSKGHGHQNGAGTRHIHQHRHSRRRDPLENSPSSSSLSSCRSSYSRQKNISGVGSSPHDGTPGTTPTTDNRNRRSPMLMTMETRKELADLIRNDLSSTDLAVVNNALDELAKHASQSQDARNVIARRGGILCIVRAMELAQEIMSDGSAAADSTDNAISSAERIQVSACRALETLALDPDNEIAIAEVGGIDAILGAMMANFGNLPIQEAAWSAFWNMSCRNAADTMTVDTDGGIEAIIICMKHHLEYPVVQKNACGALANLCLDNEQRLSALARAGGFVAISTALQRHWKDPDVRREASRALSVLLDEDDDPTVISAAAVGD